MKSLRGLSYRYDDQGLFLLDQTRLPYIEDWLCISSVEEMFAAIKELKVRGAPLIGVSAVLYLAYMARTGHSLEMIRKAALYLREARPTAVNLMHAIDIIVNALDRGSDLTSLVESAEDIATSDIELCERIANNGASLLTDGDSVLTHCNTGGLATAGVGTALGVIRRAHSQGKNIHVYVDETRPLLQGARLTTWELEKLGIPYTLICDNMAGALMAQKKIDKVIVGADRIAINGDFANKTGTYALAVLCHHHNIPFYVAAPVTTVDPQCEGGAEIPIEQRLEDEVRRDWAPKEASVYNPAFDVTPAHLVSRWILDTGCYHQGDVGQGCLRVGRKGQ